LESIMESANRRSRGPRSLFSQLQKLVVCFWRWWQIIVRRRSLVRQWSIVRWGQNTI
jgi:hypothetical protein